MPPPSEGPQEDRQPGMGTRRHSLVATGEYLLRRVIDWIGRHEASVLIALLVASLAVWGFVTVADEVREGDTQQLDEWAVRAMRRADDPAMPIGPRWMHEIGRDL